ncbi:MAG: hypothetical protein V4564_11350 [Pseudomonadota bacterium]|uniref:hypothetical protein n=1 Tax=Sphingomonas sp. ERG5 TaxID=1381597 RepID=UPI00068DA0F7|nr:hypothetical protein [Sphingomonas sp. ERG5]
MRKSVFLGGMMASLALSIAVPAYAADGKPAFSIKTPLEKLAANPGANAVLDRELPGFTTLPQYEQFKTMSIDALEAMFPNVIPHERIVAIDAALKALPADGGTVGTPAPGADAASAATASVAAAPTAPASSPVPASGATPASAPETAPR